MTILFNEATIDTVSQMQKIATNVQIIARYIKDSSNVKEK